MTTSLCLENGQSRLRPEFLRPPPNIFVKSMCDSDDNSKNIEDQRKICCFFPIWESWRCVDVFKENHPLTNASCRLEMADTNWNIYQFIFILRNQIHVVNYSIDLVLFQRRYSLKWTDRCRKRVSSWRILEDKSKWCERKWRKMRGSVPFMTNISKFISRTSNLRMTGSLPRW